MRSRQAPAVRPGQAAPLKRQWELLAHAPQFQRQLVVECPRATFHENGYPCLTTPAPTGDRKQAHRNPVATMQRCYSGWGLSSRPCMQDYTAPASPRSRCRMLGNSLHLPRLWLLLFTLLVLKQALQVTAVEGCNRAAASSPPP